MMLNCREYKDSAVVEFESSGSPSSVLVRAVPQTKLYQAIGYIDEGKSIELVMLACSKNADWIDTLPPHVFGFIVNVAMRLNIGKAAASAVAGDNAMAAKLQHIWLKEKDSSRFFREFREAVQQRIEKSAQDTNQEARN